MEAITELLATVRADAIGSLPRALAHHSASRPAPHRDWDGRRLGWQRVDH